MTAASAKVIILEYICPGLGTIMAAIMFASPLVDLQKALHIGDIGKLNPTPWAFMLGNCFGWLTYSLLVQNLWIFFSNIPGFLISIWLNFGAVKLLYQKHHSHEMTRCILKVLLDHERKMLLNYASSLETNVGYGSIATTGATSHDDGVKEEHHQESYQQSSQSSPTSITSTKILQQGEEEETVLDEKEKQLGTVDPRIQPVVEWSKMLLDVTSQKTPAPTPHEKLVLAIVTIWVLCISIIFLVPSITPKTREFIVASLVNLNLVFFYGAPLSTIYEVVKERNSSSIHVPTMMTNTLCSMFWTAYGVAVMDLFIAVPNAVGSLCGVSQILLYLYFPARPLVCKDQCVVMGTATSSSVEQHKEELELVEEGEILAAAAG